MARTATITAALVAFFTVTGAANANDTRFLDNELVINLQNVLQLDRGPERVAALADWNVDGASNVLDLLQFIQDWTLGRADFDRDGDVDNLDVLTFLSFYFYTQQAPAP